MKKTPERFIPELDGAGKVACPIDHKTLTKINVKSKNFAFEYALKAALKKKNSTV
jgi:hypothetical protein